jgi:hypothetical protein
MLTAEVVVAAGQIREKRVEVAGLLHAVADGSELVRKVRTSSLGGIKIGLDGLQIRENTQLSIIELVVWVHCW